MQQKNTSKEQIIREQRNISKCAGLLYSRILLLICLFFLIIPLQPASLYLFIFFFLIPWIVSNSLTSKKEAEPILLCSCAKKYHYTSIQLSVEQHIGRIAVLLLAVWQLSVTHSSVTAYLQLTPGVVLFLYLVCRISTTIIIHHKIHRYYMDLISLEEKKGKTSVLP